MKSLTILLATIAAAVLVACGGDGSNGGGELTVEAREWSLKPSRGEGSAGRFSITLNNSGTRVHELLIVKSDLPLTMLVSTHDLLMVRALFPRMVVMDNGKIVADGDTAVLLANTELLEAHGLEMP